MPECPTCGDDHFKSERGMKCHHKEVHNESIAGDLIECGYCGTKTRKPPCLIEKAERSFCSNDCKNQWRSGREVGVAAPWADRERLFRLYVARGLSSAQIGQKLGCDKSTVRSWLVRFDIPRREKSSIYPELNRPVLLKNWYKTHGLSINQISEIVGCVPGAVLNALDRYGIEKRPRGGTTDYPNLADERWLREEYLEKGRSAPEIAEDLGAHTDTVRHWTDKYGLKTGVETWKRYGALHNPEKLRELYIESGLGIEQVAGRVGCSPSAVQAALDRNSIGRRAWPPVGDDHPNWAGGHVPYGPGWTAAKRRKVRDRDNRECQDCGMANDVHEKRHGQKLHVHHIRPARSVEDPEERNGADNLITLCRDCHLGKWEQMTPLRPDTRTAAD